MTTTTHTPALSGVTHTIQTTRPGAPNDPTFDHLVDHLVDLAHTHSPPALTTFAEALAAALTATAANLGTTTTLTHPENKPRGNDGYPPHPYATAVNDLITHNLPNPNPTPQHLAPYRTQPVHLGLNIAQTHHHQWTTLTPDQRHNTPLTPPLTTHTHPDDYPAYHHAYETYAHAFTTTLTALLATLDLPVEVTLTLDTNPDSPWWNHPTDPSKPHWDRPHTHNPDPDDDHLTWWLFAHTLNHLHPLTHTPIPIPIPIPNQPAPRPNNTKEEVK